MEFDQKTIFQPKIWLTLFVVMHTFLFAIWMLMGPFVATGADMTEYLEGEKGLSTELAADSNIRDAFL